ncbi:MAG TPA: ATP-binding protein [Candidatus Obscuribacterales bacterium]
MSAAVVANGVSVLGGLALLNLVLIIGSANTPKPKPGTGNATTPTASAEPIQQPLTQPSTTATINQISQPQKLYRESEKKRIVAALMANSSILCCGEEGSGKSFLGAAVVEELRSHGFDVAFVEPATPKQTLLELAEQLGVSPTDLEGKALTMDALKKAIAIHLQSNMTFLVFDDAHQLEPKFRGWLKSLKRQGQPLLLIATDPPRTDVFLNMSALILKPLSEYQVRDLMERAALDRGMALRPSDLARLQQVAGGNPMLAQQTIENEYLGLDQETGSHTRYFDITPLILLIGCLFIVLRFVALGADNKTLYVLSGASGALILTVGRLMYALPKETRRIR